MYTIYWYCLIIGLALLLISLVLDGISDFFQGISFFDFHFDVLPGILPLSPLQLCAFSVGFGGMGITLYPFISFHLIIAIIAGSLLSFATHKLLDKLRHINNETLSTYDLIGHEGKVIVTIFENGIGSVSLNIPNGKITYPAQSDHLIHQGTIIKVIDIQNSILQVSDDSTYFLTKK